MSISPRSSSSRIGHHQTAAERTEVGTEHGDEVVGRIGDGPDCIIVLRVLKVAILRESEKATQHT